MFDSISATAMASCLPPAEILISYPAARRSFLSGAYDHIWSEGRRLKIRGSVNKAPSVFKVIAGTYSDDLIPCDVDELDFFAEPYLKGRRPPAGCRFKSFEAFYTWWSNYRSFCRVVSSGRSVTQVLATWADDWAELIAHLIGKRGAPVIFASYEILAILTLARECRLRGILISDLTSKTIAELLQSVEPKLRRAICKGLTRLAALYGNNHVPQVFFRSSRLLLPEVKGADVRRVPSMHPEYEDLMNLYLEEQVTGRMEVSFGTSVEAITTRGVGVARAKNIRVALRWLWQGLVSLNIASHDRPFDRSILAEPVILHRVVAACAAGHLGPVCDPVTRRAMLMISVAFLAWLFPGYSSEIDPNFYKATTLTRERHKETPNEVLKRETCLAFIRDRDFQRQFFSMPHTFYEDARPLIARFHELAPADFDGVSKDQHRALELAMMAALTAMITRFPARLATYSKIQATGKHRHIQFPAMDGYEDTVLLDIPGYIVKNGRYAAGVPLSPSAGVNPREILRWYLEDVHPLVLRYKTREPRLRRPHLLFGGLNIETLRRHWNRYVRELGLSTTPHMARHLVASLLYHRGAPIQEISELLCDSVEVTRRNYIFVERTVAIQNVMDAQAAIFQDIGV